MSFEIGASDFRVVTDPTDRVTCESLEQDIEKDIQWYRDQFVGKVHWNFVSLQSQRGPVCLSLVYSNNMYKAILRTASGNERLNLLKEDIQISFWRRCLHLSPSIYQVLKTMKIHDLGLRIVKNEELSKDITSMEERQVIKSYKFGVLYLADGQCSENQAMSNTHENASIDYKNFIKFLGEEVDLKDWKGYRGGLDTSGKNLTGKTSVFTKWKGYDVMFHISTFLPLNVEDTQRIERKRHIGNDITIIIFSESQEPFQLASLVSKQNHVVVLVQPHLEDKLKISVATKVGVLDSISLPDPYIISKDPMSREFLLHFCNF